MFYSDKIAHALLIAAALLCGCSSDEDTDVSQSSAEASHGDIAIVFHLQSNSSTTTRSAEDSYTHEQGTADEYKVDRARVYLYDHTTRLFAKSFVLNNLKRDGTDSNGNIIYEAEPVSVPQGTYDIFVTANTDRLIKQEKVDDFLADIDSLTYTRALIEDISKGVVMTNRAVDNEAVVISDNKEHQANVINIALERVVARLDIAKSAETFEITDDQGKKYASVTLDGFHIVNLARYFYTFRHTAVLSTLEEPQWNIKTNFGNIADVNGYVTDPYFFKKTIDASSFKNQDKYYEHSLSDVANPANVTWTAFNAVAQTPDFKTVYCLENCCLAPAQKNAYSTGIFFRARMEPNNNVYRLNTAGSLELVTDKSQYPEVLYYFQHNFYTSAEALAAVKSTTGTSSEQNQFQAKKFVKTDDGYRCYYNYWIRHLNNNNSTIMGVMEFGVVRNNLYRMLITNVSDLGDGGQGEIPIDPNKPDEGETNLKVVLNVKPWIVRDQTDIVL